MDSTRKTWESPWSYRESFLIAGGFFWAGMSLDAFLPSIENTLQYPYSFITILGIALLITEAYMHGKKTAIIKWLASVPAAISSIALFLGLSIIMALVPQYNSPEAAWFNRITSSYTYLIALLYFLTTLGMATLKRIVVFKWSQWGYILNHLGLWLTVAAGSFGSADIEKYTVNLEEDKLVWQGYNEQGRPVDLPLAFKLIDFSILDYEPRVNVVDSTGNPIMKKSKKPFYINKNTEGVIGDYTIKILDYLPEAYLTDSAGWKEVLYPGNAPAAYITITNGSETIEGWISCGSNILPPSFMRFREHYVVMERPHPKSYQSDLLIINRNQEITRDTLRVNQPLKNYGYMIYQTSYDEESGKWSTLSVIEIIKDPWLPVIYISMAMIIVGTLSLVYRRRNRQEPPTTTTDKAN